jgi:hypothetical protein
VSGVRVAAVAVEPLVVLLDRRSRAVFRIVLDGVEHVRDPRPMSGLQSPLALDLVLAVQRVVAAR